MTIPAFADRVKETSSTTGTGTLDLIGASAGFLSFVQGIGDSTECYYVITDGTEFEIGIGTVTAASPDTLSRDTILQTSNNDTSPISWGSGTRDVFVTLPASQILSLERFKPYTGYGVVTNGDFRLAQRGPAVATTWSSNGYGPDRWQIQPGGGNTASMKRNTFTLGQTSVSGEPSHYLTIARTVDGGNDTAVQQKIEGVRTLAGQTCTLSYWAKGSTAISSGDFLVRCYQDFGTGGSPSSAVLNNFTHPALTTAWQYFTSTITLPSISGKTLGSDGNDRLTLNFGLLGGAGTFSVDIANVKLEPGDIAGGFRPRPLAEELALCQRFYQKSFAQSVAPGYNAGTTGAYAFINHGGSLGEATGGYINLPVTMRSVPTFAFYSPSSASSDEAYNVTGTSGIATLDSKLYASQNGVFVAAADGDAFDLVITHWTADAEL